MTWFRRNFPALSLPARKTRVGPPKARLALERLESRNLLSGDPSLTLVLTGHSIAENAGPAATTAVVTRVNMDTSAALTVNLSSSDPTQAAVPASVIIPAGAASVTFNVDAVDNHVIDAAPRPVTITGWAASPLAAGPDATFGSAGYANVPLKVSSSATFPDVKVQPDGKIVAVAASPTAGATWSVSRTNADGSADTSFGTNGVVTTTFAGSTGGYANGVAFQPDGKIVVVGTVNGASNYDAWGVARYNADGTPDTTFGTNGQVLIKFTGEGGWLYDAAILPNGEILVGGMRQDPAGFAVARLTSSGAIDTSFGTNGFAGINPDPTHGWYNTTGQAMIVQPDGKILMTGIANYNGLPVVRFNADGTPDTTFNGTGVELIPRSAFGSIYTSIVGQNLALQADGKVVVTGYAYAGNPADFVVARLNTDGSLDTGFNGTGLRAVDVAGGDDKAYDVAVQADGKILVAGRAGVPNVGYDYALVRFNGDGTLDTTFNGTGKLLTTPPGPFEAIWGADLQADGKLATISGYNTSMHVVRFDTGLLTASDGLVVTDADAGLSANAGGPYTVAAGGTVQLDASKTTDPGQDPATLTYTWDLNGNGVYGETGAAATSGAEVGISPVFSAAGLTGPATVTVHLLVSDAAGHTSTADATINVLGPPPDVSVGDVTQLEGNGSPATFLFSVQLSAASSVPVTVTYATADGSATAGQDYTAASGSVTFAAGETSKNIAVSVLDDTAPEPDETFFVNLTGSTNGNIARAQGTGTILSVHGLAANNDSYQVDENQTLTVSAAGVLANDTAANSNPLQPVLVAGPAHGTLTLNKDGSFVYTPTANYSGGDSFTYRATEGTLTSNTATVSIAVNFVDRPPVARDDSFTMLEDHTLSVSATAGVTSLTMNSQPGDYIGQGQTYAYSAASGTFTASRNYDNGVSFSYTSATNPGYVWWYLDFAAPGNVPLTPGTYAGATRFPFQSATQPGLDVSGEGRGSNTLTGTFTVLQATYDPSGKVLSFDATFEQHSEGATPALFGEIKYNASAGPLGVLANDTDPDNQALTARLVSGPTHGGLALNADGTFTYTPDEDFAGTDTFTYRANDGTLDSNLATVSIDVTPVNHAPSFTRGADLRVPEGSGAQTVAGWATNISAGPPNESGQAVNFLVSTDNPALFATAPAIDAGGNLTFTPAAGALGSATVTVRLHDDGGTANGGVDTSVAQTFSIVVYNVAPTVTPPAGQTADEGAAQSFGLGSFTDPGSDGPYTVDVDWGDGSAHTTFTANAQGALAAQAHTYAEEGAFTATVTVTDNGSAAGSATFQVTVNDAAPLVSAGADRTLDEGGSFSGTGSFGDPGADTWTATVDYGDGSGVQALTLAADKTFALIHAYKDEGAYTVTVRVTDDEGVSGVGTFLVTVNNVAPTVAAGPDATLDEGGTLSRTGSFSDPGADTWTATVDYGDGSGVQSLTLNADKSFALAHTYATPGSYTVKVVATDDDKASGSGTFTVTVDNVAPTPVAPANQTALEGTAQSFALGSFSDPGPDGPWQVLVSWGDGATTPFTASSQGPLPGQAHAYANQGTYNVTVQVTDASGAAGSAGFSVSVANVAPTVSFTSAPPSGARGQARTFTGSFTDPGTADSWTATVNYGDGSGVQPLTLNADKTFSFSPTYVNSGTYTVTVTVRDKDGGTGSVSRSIVIRAVDLQPDTLDPTKTMLVVGGTSGNDNIAINPGAAAGQYAVTINGVSQGTFTAHAGSPFSRIVAFGQAGDDAITVSSRITLPSWLYGGTGNDTLRGGGGNNVLLGGDGNDNLYAGGGRDLLIGGRGADQLHAGGSDDILIAGYTSYDANEAALNAIMSEWSSSHSYATRINNLTNGSGSADRLNGSYFLQQGVTVFDDLDADTLYSISGQTWMFYDPSRDKVKRG